VEAVVECLGLRKALEAAHILESVGQVLASIIRGRRAYVDMIG
jgi:hypothetical protein